MAAICLGLNVLTHDTLPELNYEERYFSIGIYL